MDETQQTEKLPLYIGQKLISAMPEKKDGKEGYVVIYSDGYKSWSPKDVFEKAYQPITKMSFAGALKALKDGNKVARAGWNGKGMFIFLVPGSTFKVNRAPLLGIYPEGTEIKYHSHIDMKTATGEIVPWLASQTDVLAEDWTVL